jgi:hypothetical protein
LIDHGFEFLTFGECFMKRRIFRQGDVVFTKVSKIPTRANKKESQEVVLAYGEVTGHKHAVVDGLAEMFDHNDRTFLRVLSDKAMLAHGNDSQIARFVQGEEIDTVKEDVHAPHIIEKGDYEFWIQREYDPERERRVMD